MVTSAWFNELLSLSKKAEAINVPPYTQSQLKIEYENSTDSETIFNGKEPTLPFVASNVYYAPIVQWRRLSALSEECKPVYEVEFDVTDSGFQFSTGDTIAIIPKNRTSEVNFIIEHLELKSEADNTCRISEIKSGKSSKFPHLPIKSRLRHILTNIVEIRGVLKKLLILALSKYTEQNNEKRILEYLCSKEGSSAYKSYILNKNICLIDVFRIFPSCKPPIEVILTYLPRLLPRPYSIANSRLNNPNKIKICFSIMDIGNQRKGLTTTWMEEIILESPSNKVSEVLNIEDRLRDLELKEDKTEKIPIYIRRSMTNFSMPKDLETPLLLIGPGTGVAPYIGFLEERKILKERNPELKLGITQLYFGCRKPDLDFLYEKELDDFVSCGVLNKLRTAFSRMEGEDKYIQNLLLQDGEEIVKFIENGASVYICGDLNSMATQIKDIFVQCLVEYSSKSQEEALEYISELQKNNKYLVDMWS